MKKINERKIALNIINDVETNNSYINISLNLNITKYQLQGKSRTFITELVYGVFRNRNIIDWYLEKFCKLNKQSKLVINILRIGAYQLMFLNKVPDFASVSEAVNLAKKYGGSSLGNFVNAVLRNLKRNLNNIELPAKDLDLTKYLSVKYSHPEWMIKLFLEKFTEEITLQICEANNLHAPLSARVNNLKVSNDVFKNNLLTKNIDVIESNFVPGVFLIKLNSEISLLELDEYNKGWFQIQDESSSIVGFAVNPQKGDLVLDLCAAPGGKITHLAEFMRNTGKIVGCDIHQNRINLIKENISKLGINIIELVCGDACNLFPGDYYEKCDKVLVDVPCSGLGVLRRRLDARWNKKQADLAKLPLLQYNILSAGYKCLKRGGILVYSTCTILPEENEEVIYNFLKNQTDVKIESLKDILPKALNRFITCDGFLRIYPNVSHTMDGFFIARLVKD